MDDELEKKLIESVRNKYKDRGMLPSNKNINEGLKICTDFLYPCAKTRPEKNLRLVDEDLAKAKYTRAIQIELHPTDDQKQKLAFMFEAFIRMYNLTLKHCKQGFRENRILKQQLGRDLDKNTDKVFILSEGSIKKALLQQKNQLKYEIEAQAKYTIYTHMLDEAMSLVISMYKSAFSNYEITRKPFRIRFWKHNKENKIMKIESEFFKGYTKLSMKDDKITQKALSGFFIESLGKNMKATLDGSYFDLMMVPSTATLVYNEVSKKYILNVPIHYQDDRSIIDFLRNRKTQNNDQNSARKNIISLDPGLRTFLTGFSDNEVVKIGEDFCDRIYKTLLRKNRNRREQQKIKKQVLAGTSTKSKSYFRLCTLRKELKLIYRKLTNLSDELHWKTILHLTSSYNTILIGNMSTKRISNNRTSNLSRINKSKGYALAFYKFRSRLVTRCKELNINYKEVDEFYTSKTCSNCGWINDNLGDSKIYRCEGLNCGRVIDRDVNAARGIYIKTLD